VQLRRRGRLPRWYGESLFVDECVNGEVPVGSCATVARETGQGRKTAAFSGHDCVPQIAWPSPHFSCARGATLFMREVTGEMQFHLRDQQVEDFPLVAQQMRVQMLDLATSNPQPCQSARHLTRR